MTELQSRLDGAVGTVRVDQRDDWPTEARVLRGELLERYGEHERCRTSPVAGSPVGPPSTPTAPMPAASGCGRRMCADAAGTS